MEENEGVYDPKVRDYRIRTQSFVGNNDREDVEDDMWKDTDSAEANVRTSQAFIRYLSSSVGRAEIIIEREKSSHFHQSVIVVEHPSQIKSP